MNNERISIKEEKSNLKGIKFKDIVVSRKDWLLISKNLSTEELLVIAIGSKYNSTGKKGLIKSLICVLGLIASVAFIVLQFMIDKISQEYGLFPLIGGIAGYFLFNFLAIKQVGYWGTYDRAKRRLSKDLRIVVDNISFENSLLGAINTLLFLLLALLTIPYKVLLMVLTTLVPKLQYWAIAKGESSVVIPLPEGYSIDELDGAMRFYDEHTFGRGIDEHLEEQERIRLSQYKAYKIGDTNKILYSNDCKNFYRHRGDINDWDRFGISEDNGKTIILEKDLRDLQ